MAISENELQERIAIVKRFRSLLEQQRDKYREYLLVLEKQNETIQKDDTEAALQQTALAKNIVKNLSTLQKSIAPMEALYKSVASNRTESAPVNPEEIATVNMLHADLGNLQLKVIEQNAANQALLKKRMVEIRSRLDNLKNPYKNNKSVYADDSEKASFITIDV